MQDDECLLVGAKEEIEGSELLYSWKDVLLKYENSKKSDPSDTIRIQHD